MRVFDLFLYICGDSMNVFLRFSGLLLQLRLGFSSSNFTNVEKRSFRADERRVFNRNDTWQHVNGKNSSVFP